MLLSFDASSVPATAKRMGGPALVIEPDRDDRRRVCTALERAGIESLAITSPDGAGRMLYERRPGIVLLAADPPADAAWAALERIRDLTDVPVLVMSSTASELAKVRALRAGADDYVTKPLALAELVARIEAISRRLRVDEPENGFDDGFVSIDLLNFEVEADGRRLQLTPLEFRLLLAFVRHPNQVLNRSQLLDMVWGNAAGDAVDRVKLTVSYLRGRFQDAGVKPPIETVRGLGYRYRPTNVAG